MPYDLSGSGRSVCRKWCPWPKVTHFSWLPLVLDLSTCTRYTHQRVGPPQAGTGPWFAWVTFIRPGSVSPGTSCFVHTHTAALQGPYDRCEITFVATMEDSHSVLQPHCHHTASPLAPQINLVCLCANFEASWSSRQVLLLVRI